MRPSPSVWSRSQGCIPPLSALSHPSARRGVTRPQSQGVTMHVVAAAVTHMSELWLLVLLLPSISIGQDSAVTSKMSGSSMQPHHSGVLNLQQQQQLTPADVEQEVAERMCARNRQGAGAQWSSRKAQKEQQMALSDLGKPCMQ